MSSYAAILDPNAVKYLDGPFEFVPVIRDILRTRYCAPGSILLVEGIDTIAVSSSGRWQAVRLLLGDGLICIQALLSGDMHRFVRSRDIGLGAYVRLEEFSIEWERDNGQRVVFFAVESLLTVGWNESYQALQKDSDADVVKHMGSPPAPAASVPQQAAKDEEDEEDEDAIEEAFETFQPLAFPLRRANPVKAPKPKPAASKSQPIALQRDWHDPQEPLKLTTLRSIPHLPYRQNWSCNVLAVVVSLSDVEPSNLPPKIQRSARIADPSTSKQVHLTVFLDPEEFAPRIGSVVLLVGVKNHRFDGGSLKKYASDKGKGQWWFENPEHLGWCDVAALKAWWAEMEEAKANESEKADKSEQASSLVEG